MRIQAEAFHGGIQIVVEHHEDVSFDPAPIVDAVQAALSDALSQPLAAPAIADARRPPDEQEGEVVAERVALGEVPDRGPEVAEAEVGAITDLDAVAETAVPEVAADSAPPAGERPGGRSHDALRAQALELLDDRGLPENQVCEQLGISLARLRRWDLAGHDELAVSGGGRR